MTAVTPTQQEQPLTTDRPTISFEEMVGAAFRLQEAASAFTAFGARVQLAAAGDHSADPDVVAALDDVIAAAGIPPVAGLPAEQQARLAGMIASLFRQTADVIEHPERPPGWRYNDPLVLQGQGRASMAVPRLIAAAHPDLASVSSFLDVGTGVGWLAVAATTEVWPGCEVVGIDVWDPALELAAANVAGAGVGDRVTIRRQDLAELDDVDRYDCAWLPSFFLPRDALAAGLSRVVRALRPGGWAVVGRVDLPDDPLGRATSRLGIVRDGGSDLADAEVLTLLGEAGCADVRRLEHGRPVPLGLFGGRKP